MKRFVVILIAVVAMVLPLVAQNTKNKTLNFIYIAHSPKTQTDRLIDRLREDFSRARSLKNPTVFYLANGRTPVVVQMNTANDNRKEFENIIYRLQTIRSHSVNAQMDVNNIIKLYTDWNVVDENGALQYQKVEWTYYIDSSFWQANYNESIIAKLYWSLDMQSLESRNMLKVNIYHGRGDEVKVDKSMPFGAKNLCKSMKFNMLPY